MASRLYKILPFLLCLSACVSLGEQAPAPVTKYGQSSGGGSAGMHNVVGGETLFMVSKNYRLPMRDIAVLNNLQAPFKLHDGQRLRLPPPQEYKIRPGDTIYDVSKLFGVNSSEIARLNNMNAPYSVRTGQVLRLPSVTRKTQSISKIAKMERTPVQPASLHSEPVQKYVLSAPQPKHNILQEPLDAPASVASSHTSVPNVIPPPQKILAVPEQNIKTASLPKEEAPLKVITKVTAKTPPRSSSKFLRPVDGKILSDFGPKKTGLHNDGINISAAKGTPVRAAENGVVVYAGNELKGSGNLVLIRHEDQWVTAYAHMNNIAVRKGDVIKRGQDIGQVGSTGSVTEPQLHFEIRRGMDAINPKNYIEG